MKRNDFRIGPFFYVFCEELVFYEENGKEITTVTPFYFRFYICVKFFIRIERITKFFACTVHFNQPAYSNTRYHCAVSNVSFDMSKFLILSYVSSEFELGLLKSLYIFRTRSKLNDRYAKCCEAVGRQ